MKPMSVELKLNIDLKHSSFKKINNYFKYLQKEKDLVVFSKAKGQNNDYIQKIKFDNDLIKKFKPHIHKIKFLSQHQKEEEEKEKIRDNIMLNKDEKIEVTKIFKPNQKIKSLFSLYIPNFNEKEYYSLKDCKEVLIKYLKEQKLFVENENCKTRLDKKLEEIFNIHYKEFSIKEREYSVDEVLQMWKSNLNGKSCIVKTTNDPNDESKKTEGFIYQKDVHIRICSKKYHNKNVTLIEGLEKFIDIKDAVKTLSKAFATSVTIKDDIQGMKNAIFIQGYWTNQLVEILTKEFKMKKELIRIEDRLKNKKNR